METLYKTLNPYIAVALLTAITFMQVNRTFKFNSRLYDIVKQRLNAIQQQMCFINNGVINCKIFKNEELPEGYTYGMLNHNFTDTMCITNGVDNKRIHKNEVIPIGWWSGNSNNNSLLGKICITNGKVNTYIYKYEQVPDGFYIGTHVKPAENMKLITDGIVDKYIPVNDTIPTGWHAGSKNKGQLINITNGIQNARILKTDIIPDGWYAGITTQQHQTRKGTKRICNKKLKINKVLKPGDFLTDEQIDDGWEYGIFISENAKNSKKVKKHNPTKNFINACKNSIWINNGISSKRINKTQPIPNGFVLGRLKKSVCK